MIIQFHNINLRMKSKIFKFATTIKNRDLYKDKVIRNNLKKKIVMRSPTKKNFLKFKCKSI